MFIAGFPAGPLAANCYLVATGAGAECVIIDPGEKALDHIVATVSQHRLTPVAALLTHGHLDHAASLGLVTSHFNIPGMIQAADEYMLDAPLAALSPELRAMLGGYPLPKMRPRELRYLLASTPAVFGELTLTVTHTPGHTGGSVILGVSGDDSRPDVLFTGDTLFAGSIGRTDLPGGSAAELDASLLRSVLTQSDAAVVLPGHGPRSTIGAERRSNPYLLKLLVDTPEAVTAAVAASTPEAGN